MHQIDTRLWEAAVELFALKGFAASGIREIADRAGLSVSALYYYVKTKEELLLQIMRDTQELLVSAGRQVTERLSEPEERLAGLVQLHVLGHTRYQLEAVVVDNEIRALGDEGREQVIGLRDQYEQFWNDTLDEGIRQGVFSVTSPRTARLALVQMCNGVASWFSPNGPLDRRELAVQFADLALAMVRATSDGQPATVADLELPEIDWFMSLIDDLETADAEAAHAVPAPSGRTS